jgi:hypothetical protein
VGTVGERRRKAAENVVGGALGFAVAVGLVGLGMKAMEAIGADPIVFVVVLVTAGSGFAYGCVQAGMAVVEVVSLYVRGRRYLRAGRLEQLAPVLERMVELDELFRFDHPRTSQRRHALVVVLTRLGRFEEAAEMAGRNAYSASRRLGYTHQDTVAAEELARTLREAARDPAVADGLREAVQSLPRGSDR